MAETQPFNGLLLLLKAALFSEEQKKSDREKEVLDEHGYASSGQIAKRHLAKKTSATLAISEKLRPSPARLWTGNKNIHNQKEKSRRAGLREMMSSLRKLIPIRNGMEKLTTLQLLKCARHHIRHLEEIARKNKELHARLSLRQSRLKSKLTRLQTSGSRTVLEEAAAQQDIEDVDIVGFSSSGEDESEAVQSE